MAYSVLQSAEASGRPRVYASSLSRSLSVRRRPVVVCSCRNYLDRNASDDRTVGEQGKDDIPSDAFSTCTAAAVRLGCNSLPRSPPIPNARSVLVHGPGRGRPRSGFNPTPASDATVAEGVSGAVHGVRPRTARIYLFIWTGWRHLVLTRSADQPFELLGCWTLKLLCSEISGAKYEVTLR